ncbi:helix-turn-helix domain-containing protein [Streptomyces sp. A73]|nr:helix-turn-helix domain-containing protein [Streptomyces sp. A73]
MPPHDQDLKRLGKHVERRRIELYPSRKAAADTDGMSKDTWLKIERGETVRAGSYAKVESALHWGRVGGIGTGQVHTGLFSDAIHCITQQQPRVAS